MNTDTRTVLQKAQGFALGQVLSDWDSTFDYDDIVATLRSGAYADGDDGVEDQVTPWEAYELLTGSQVADEIEGMVQHLVRLFGDTK